MKEEIIKINKEEISKQQKELNEILVYSMSSYVYEKLFLLKRGKHEYKFRDDQNFIRDLQFLQDHGYIELFPLLSSLKEGDELVGKIKLTECGHKFVDFREEFERRHHPSGATETQR